MTAQWTKIVRDFRQESTRAILVVLAIAVGIAGFASVLASYAILTRELNQGYLATNPASAIIRTDAVDDELLRAIVATGKVSNAEARRSVSGRIRSSRAGWRNLVLFVVRDYANIRVSTLNRENGAWPPATGEILIERDAFQVARTGIGETVTVRTPNGKEQNLRVSGSVHDVGQAQARMENIVYGYITLATLQQLGEEPVLNQINILVAENRFDESHIRSVVADVEKAVESRGHPVLRVSVPTPGKHPHASIMGLLMLVMSSFGLFVMLLSGIIMVNLLTAMMASQVRQIGVMKATGGTRWQIARIYFGQALLLGIAAVLVALPVGIWGSRVLCRAMAVFLNFDILSFAIPAWVYLLVGVVGIIVPLLSAAFPVWKGSGISVREALADFGVSSNQFGAGALDRLLTGVGGLTRPFLLAIRNSFRRRARLVLTLLTLSAGGLFFMTALNIRASMIGTLDRLFATKNWDLSIALRTMAPMEKVDRALRNTPGMARFEGWIVTDATLPLPGAASAAASSGGASPHGGGGGDGGLHGGGGAPSGDRFPVIAIPPQTKYLRLDIVEGRDLQPGEMNSVVLNTALAAKGPQMKVGNTVRLSMGPGIVPLRIVGIAREPFSPPIAYMPRRLFDEIGGHAGMTNSIRVVLDKADPASIERVKSDLDGNLAREGLQASGVSSKADSRFGFDQHMVMIYVMLIILSSMIGGVGGLGLMTTMSLNILERRREMGILRAIGATPRVVSWMVVAEGGVIGVWSWAIAALAAWPVSRGLGNLLVKVAFQSGLDFKFDIRGPLIWLAACLLLGALASALPAWHAAQRPVHEALGYE